MPTLSEMLSQLSDSMAQLSQKAKEAEERTAEARAYTHEQLEAHAAEARATAQRRHDELTTRAAEIKGEVASS